MLRVAAAQDSPAFLNKRVTTEKIVHWIETAAKERVRVLAFGETFLPGYPFWLSSTGGAKFEDPEQQEAYRLYLEAAVTLDGPELQAIEKASRAHGIFVVLGVAERSVGVASGSVYCTLVPIHPERGLLASHRKLMPTYEERLIWASGDGFGLESHEFEGSRISALNCWENWMPLARYAVYGSGTELHVALWPGAVRNTEQSTRFIAQEGRIFVLSAGGLLSRADVPDSFPLKHKLGSEAWFHDGGSAIAGPDGAFLVEPVSRERGLVIADLDMAQIGRARQNFDPTGHYSRPDVFELQVNRRRLAPVRYADEPAQSPLGRKLQS